MGRILSIDYGNKRVGLAVTDPLKMIATRLTTVSSEEIWRFLADYFAREEVELVLVGYPKQLNNQPSEAIRYINPFLKKFCQTYPEMPVQQVDERFFIQNGVSDNDRCRCKKEGQTEQSDN